MVLTLLSIRWMLFRNAIRRSSATERRRALNNLIISALVIAGVGAMSYAFFEPFANLSRTDQAMRLVLAHLPACAFFTAFWMLLLSAVTVGIQKFYLNHELSLLLAAPLRAGAVFGAKFVEATLTNAALFLTIGSPVLLAYAFARGTITPPYIIYLALLMIAFSALPTGLGILLSFVLMRVLPANRTRDMVGALGIMAFALIYFFLSVSVTRTHDPAAIRQGTGQIARMLARPVFRSGPWAWAGDVLSGDHVGRIAWLAIALLWLLAIGVVLLCAAIGQWIHWQGWANAQESAPHTARVGAVGADWELKLKMLPAPLRAVFLKDFRSLRRDMRQLSLLFIPIAVVAVFLFQMTQAQVHRVPALLMAMGLYPVLAMISLRIAMSGFVTENRAIWLMLAAPNDTRTVLMGKFLYAYALSGPLATLAAGMYCYLKDMSILETAVTVGFGLCAVAGFCGIGVGASAFLSDFEAENARSTVSAGGRLMTFGVQMGYLALLMVVTVVPWAIAVALGSAEAIGYIGAGAAVLVVSAGFVAAPIMLGAARLRKLEW